MFAIIIVVKGSSSGIAERNFVEDLSSFLCTLYFGLDSSRQIYEIFRFGLIKVFYSQKLALSEMLAWMFVRHLENARFLRDGGKCRPSLALGRRGPDVGDVGFHCNNERRNNSRLGL